jgi:hypothetical protein
VDAQQLGSLAPMTAGLRQSPLDVVLLVVRGGLFPHHQERERLHQMPCFKPTPLIGRRANRDVLGDGVFVEKVKIETRSVFDLAQVRKEASAVGHLARRLEALKSDAAEIASLAAVLADLDKRLPPELREGDGALTLSDPATIRRFVEEVEATLLPRLLEGAEG